MPNKLLMKLEEELALEGGKQTAAILGVDYRRYWEWWREQRPVPTYIKSHIATLLAINVVAPVHIHELVVMPRIKRE